MRVAIATHDALTSSVLRLGLAAGGHALGFVVRDAEEVARRCLADRPDLLLLDCQLAPQEVHKIVVRLMATAPCPILMVTRDVAADAASVFAALRAGALDVVCCGATGADARAESAAVAAKLGSIERLLGDAVPPSYAQPGEAPSTPPPRSRPAAAVARLVVIGASAGGPPAIASILASLPADFPAAIVVVQHVDACFGGPMASWLASQCSLDVRVARSGDVPRAGTVLMAGTDLHLVITDDQSVDLQREPSTGFYRPSIDVLFRSAIRWRGAVVAVLLTGMGRDGAKGLLALKGAGAHTIAQDQRSSAVYGMPKAAVELGAAMEVLPLASMAARLRALVKPSGASGLIRAQPTGRNGGRNGEGGERG